MVPLDLQYNSKFEYLRSISDKIEKTREELNLLAVNIDNKDTYNELLNKSQLLDKLINEYMKELNKKNIKN